MKDMKLMIFERNITNTKERPTKTGYTNTKIMQRKHSIEDIKRKRFEDKIEIEMSNINVMS